MNAEYNQSDHVLLERLAQLEVAVQRHQAILDLVRHLERQAGIERSAPDGWTGIIEPQPPVEQATTLSPGESSPEPSALTNHLLELAPYEYRAAIQSVVGNAKVSKRNLTIAALVAIAGAYYAGKITIPENVRAAFTCQQTPTIPTTPTSETKP